MTEPFSMVLLILHALVTVNAGAPEPVRAPTGLHLPLQRRLPLSPHIPHQHASNHTCRHRKAAHDGNAHQPFLCDLVVDQRSQVARLQVCGLLFQQQVVVPPCLCVVAQFEVTQGQIVQAFAAALGRGAEDFGEEDDAELLIVAASGFYKTLRGLVVGFHRRRLQLKGENGEGEGGRCKGTGKRSLVYPCVVELGLHTDHVSFLLVLRA